MKTVKQLEERVDEQTKDFGTRLFMQMSNNVHPLMIFVKKYWKAEGRKHVPKLTRENVIQEIKEYLPFAIGKAEGERGISAERSMFKFTEWLWVLEDDDLLNVIDKGYIDYGLAILNIIKGKYAK